MNTAEGKAFTFGQHTCAVERVFGVGFAQWSVCELEDPEAPHYGPALIFISVGFVRRVRNYPLNWRELSDEALYAISWNG